MSTLRRICCALSLAIVHCSRFFASKGLLVDVRVETLKLVSEAEMMHHHSSFEVNISKSLVEDIATTPCEIKQCTDWKGYLRNRMPPTKQGATNVVAQIMDPPSSGPYGGTVINPEMHYVGGSMIALSWVYSNKPGSYVIIVLLFDDGDKAVVRGDWGGSVFAPDFFKFRKGGTVDDEGRTTVLDTVRVAMELPEGEAIDAPSIIKGYTFAIVTLEEEVKKGQVNPCQDIYMHVIEVTADLRGKGLAKSLVRLLLHKLERNIGTWKSANPAYDENLIHISGQVANNPHAAGFWTSIMRENMKCGAKVSQIPLRQVQEKVSKYWPVN